MRSTKMILTALVICLLLWLSVGIVPAAEDEPGEATDYDIPWQVISNGGTDGSSTNFKLQGTVSQTAVGTGTSASYSLRHGFWQDFSGADTSCCTGITGNVDNDPGEVVDIGDGTIPRLT